MRNAIKLSCCVLASALASTACDLTVDEPAPEPPAPQPVATAEDVYAYQELVGTVDAAAATYRTAMADPGLTPEGCVAAHGLYDDDVRPAIGHMLGLADELEGFMFEHGGQYVADIACSSRAMMAELDDHDHVACMWPATERNRAEATRHLAIMDRYIDHAADRANEMLTGMEGAGWVWSGLIGCQ